MSIYSQIALKNIKRNKQRTIVTIILSTFATAILIFASALMDGEHKILLKNAVEIYPGYIQIINKKFKDNPNFDNLIENSDEIVNKLTKNTKIKVLSQRFETFVLLSSSSKSLGAMIVGIQPKIEEKISKLKKSLYKGEYLSNTDKNSAYIGNELAKNLKVDIGDTISFIGNGADYSFCADNLIIKGIFQTGLFEFDLNSIFVNKKYFDELFVSSDLSTHIIILPKKTENSLSLSNEIQTNLNDKLLSQSWEEFMESLVKAMKLDSVFGYITLSIFFIVILFVILIYTTLSIYSRIKEIGVLRAIGTQQKEILLMLLYESFILSGISVILGGIIGAIFSYYFYINPIDLGSQFEEQFKQYGFANTVLPTDFNPLNIIRDMFIMFVLCVLSTIPPVLKVNKYKPIEAIHHV